MDEEPNQQTARKSGPLKNQSRISSLSKPEPVIFKLLRSPGIDSTEPIPPAYVAWRAGVTTPTLLGSLPPQIVIKFHH